MALAAAVVGVALSGCTALMGGGAPSPSLFDNGTQAAQSGTSTNPAVDSREHARIVAAYGGIFHDARVEQMLAPIVSKIVAASDRPDQPYRITILNAPAVNAFALPDGYLYVTRGLLALASDSSEVAAVLGHEMGHVIANHAAQREQKARDALVVSRVVTDVLGNNAGGQLALAASQRTLAAFSQQQELEADAIGIKIIGRAGYDPFAAARFLNVMQRYAAYRSQMTLQDQRPDFLATHPATPERIAFAIKAARQFGAPGVGVTDRDRYLAGIDGMVFGDDPNQGFVRDRTFVHPGLGIGFTVPEGFVIDNTSDAVLATGVDGTALRFDAVGLSRDTALTDYLKSGWVNGLDEGSVQGFTVNGLQAASATAEAKGWHFRIAVIRTNSNATYRFIFANETVTPAFVQEATETTNGFRVFSPAELARYHALHIHIVTVGPNDTDATLVRRMHGVDRPLQLFLVLNDLQSGAPLTPGTKLKIVNDS